MRALGCAEFADIAPELALGNLCGDERAAAIAHLERCTACQHDVNALTTFTDRLLLLGPRVEPRAGFEQRVLAALTTDRAARGRWSLSLAAAAIVIVLAAALLVLGVGSGRSPTLAVADIRAADGEVVGEVVVREDAPAALSMTLPGWAEQMTGRSAHDYTVRIGTRDGRSIVRPVVPTAGPTWVASLDVDPDDVATVTLVGHDGYVWCQARFEPPAERS